MAYPRVGKRFLVLPSNTAMATQANSASSGGAFPYLTIDLDASAGRWFGDAAVAALAAHCPLLWNFSALVTLDPYDSDDDIGAYRLPTLTRRWLHHHVSCWGSDKKPPGRLNMKEALVRYSPAPWDIIR